MVFSKEAENLPEDTISYLTIDGRPSGSRCRGGILRSEKRANAIDISCAEDQKGIAPVGLVTEERDGILG